jgi:hypothetical protein
LGDKGVPLAYVTRTDDMVHIAADDPEDRYLTVEQEMIQCAPHSGPAFRNDRRTVWGIMSTICGHYECWICIKPAQQAKYGRKAYKLLFDHYFGPNNVGNMASSTDTKMVSTFYNGEKKVSLGGLMYEFTLINTQF